MKNGYVTIGKWKQKQKLKQIQGIFLHTNLEGKGSVRNRSGIIAQHGVSNAKPSMVDLILWLPETNFR